MEIKERIYKSTEFSDIIETDKTENEQIENGNCLGNKTPKLNKQKKSYIDTPQQKVKYRISNANNIKNASDTYLTSVKKKNYRLKKIEEKKNQDKLIKYLKQSEKTKTPSNNKRDFSLSINQNPIVIVPPSKNERVDRNGIVINKSNKKKVHISFLDKVDKKNLIKCIQVESFKKYNLIEDINIIKQNDSESKNQCCLIF